MRAEVVAMDAEHLNMEAIQKAGKILKEGGLVAFPTETVYGLGGNAPVSYTHLAFTVLLTVMQF